MKIYIARDERGEVVGAFTDEHMADVVSNCCCECGDASYDGCDAVELQVDPPMPELNLCSRNGYRLRITRNGDVLEQKWIVPLHRNSDGVVVAAEMKTRFLGFDDNCAGGPQDGLIEVVLDDRNEDGDAYEAERVAKRIAATMVKAGLWPEAVDADLVARINATCVSES